MRIWILIFLIVGTTGCGSVGPQLRAPAKANPHMAQGTGFLVRPDGLILTAWHVVKDAGRIGVRCEGRERVFATVAERSPTLDLAVLQTPLTDMPYLSTAPVIGVDGAVVGIVTATQTEERFFSATGGLPQNVNWAVKVEYATPLFDLPRPQPPSASRTEAIERASQAVCIVITERPGAP